MPIPYENEYRALFASMEIAPERRAAAASFARKIIAGRDRYQRVAEATGVPWFVVGLIHAMECSQFPAFTQHLHNGDSLKRPTWQVPKGRPAATGGPFTFEESAIDAMRCDKLDKVDEWSLPQIAYQLEKYNGWGTRKKGIHTPYLWSWSNHYRRGKYVADHVWSDTAVSQQPGAMVILKALMEEEPHILAAEPEPDKHPWPIADDRDEERASASVADIRPLSRKLTLIARVRAIFTTVFVSLTGLTFADAWGYALEITNALKAVAADHVLAIVGGIILVGLAVLYVIEHWAVDDFRSGNWTPSRSEGP